MPSPRPEIQTTLPLPMWAESARFKINSAGAFARRDVTRAISASLTVKDC